MRKKLVYHRMDLIDCRIKNSIFIEASPTTGRLFSALCRTVHNYLEYILALTGQSTGKVNRGAYNLDMSLFSCGGIRFGWGSIIGIIPGYNQISLLLESLTQVQYQRYIWGHNIYYRDLETSEGKIASRSNTEDIS